MAFIVLAGPRICLAEHVKFSPYETQRYILKNNISFKLKKIYHDLFFNSQATAIYFFKFISKINQINRRYN